MQDLFITFLLLLVISIEIIKINTSFFKIKKSL